MQNALKVIAEVQEEYGTHFGRGYAPLVEQYRMEDAEIALMNIGSMTGAAKDAVDEARQAGSKVGIIKVKTFSPFPVDALVAALGKVQAIGVVDRSVAFRWNCGPLYQETLGVLYRLGRHVPSASFIGGLAGADLTVDHFLGVIRETEALRHGRLSTGPVWLNEND